MVVGISLDVRKEGGEGIGGTSALSRLGGVFFLWGKGKSGGGKGGNWLRRGGGRGKDIF